MKKSTPFLAFLFILFSVTAFAQDAQQARMTARSFMAKNDFSNAILVLNRAIITYPKNSELIKDLAYDYYLNKDYDKALAAIKPIIDGADADDQSFQIGGNIYQALKEYKDARRLYKKGLKKFPESGALYNDFGEFLGAQGDQTAITQWEKGIKIEPSYSKNYYNASRYYSIIGDNIWGVLYGEIFLNMEPLSPYTPELKGIVLEDYKKIFADADITKKNKGNKNKFAVAFITCLNKESSAAAVGINPGSLTIIRTRFILDWENEYAAKYPFRLFQLQQQLLQQGLFEAYNQWLFGMAQDLSAYQVWANAHVQEFSNFDKFQKSRVFKVPTGQYYH
jgi:tetratricopeptide (TPR) repeat protein